MCVLVLQYVTGDNTIFADCLITKFDRLPNGPFRNLRNLFGYQNFQVYKFLWSCTHAPHAPQLCFSEKHRLERGAESGIFMAEKMSAFVGSTVQKAQFMKKTADFGQAYLRLVFASARTLTASAVTMSY